MARSSQFPPSVNPGIPKEQKPPIGWEFVQFGEILRVEERPAKLIDEVEYQLVTAKRNRGGIIHRENLIGKKILTKNQYYLRSGDFLISRRQIVHGACGIVPEWLDGAIASNEYATLLPNNDILLEYLSYYSHTTHFQQTCFHSSIGVDVEKMVFKINDWLKRKMLLPPISEQQKICDILRSVDDAIHATLDVIDQIQKVKLGLMQQLLTRGIGHTRFKQTDIGEIPEDWDVVPISNIGEVVTGSTPSTKIPEYWGGDIPFVTPSDISDAPYVTTVQRTVTSLGASEGRIIPSGSVLITCIASIGKNALVNRDCLTNQQINSIVCNDLCDPTFIYNSMEMMSNKLSQIAGITAVPIVNKSLFSKMQLALPPLKEQQNIASILSSHDEVIQVAKHSLNEIRLIKKGLIQDLLTGRVRVKLDGEITT